MSHLRELIIETIRAELPALAREAVQRELQRQTHDVLLQQIELVFKHNTEVKSLLRAEARESLECEVDSVISIQVKQNEEVRDTFRDLCFKLLTEGDGPLGKMLKVMAKTQGDMGLEVTELSDADKEIYHKADILINQIAAAVTRRLAEELASK